MKKMRIPLVVTAFVLSAITVAYCSLSRPNASKRPHARVQDDANVTPADVKLLHAVLLKHHILFGSAISPADITQRAPRPQNYLSEVSKYFNFYTISVSYQIVEQQQGVFNFDLADKAVEFAIANHAKVKAHALVTGGSLPKWLTSGNFTPDQLREILRNHVTTIVKHFNDKYPGEVIDYNVVNEPTCNGGRLNADLCFDDGLKKNIWTVIHKPGSDDPSDYIQYAFEWAHQADPSAKLFINEDGIEDKSNPKIDRFYDIVKMLVNKRVPINGIGFESHIRFMDRDKYGARELTATMDRFAGLGLESQVSEFDVAMTGSLRRIDMNTPMQQIPIENPQSSDFEQQGEVYKSFLIACLNAKNCTGFTTWGPWDTATYMNTHWAGKFYPHLLGDDLKPKLTFKYLVDAAKDYNR